MEETYGFSLFPGQMASPSRPHTTSTQQPQPLVSALRRPRTSNDSNQSASKPNGITERDNELSQDFLAFLRGSDVEGGGSGEDTKSMHLGEEHHKRRTLGAGQPQRSSLKRPVSSPSTCNSEVGGDRSSRGSLGPHHRASFDLREADDDEDGALRKPSFQEDWLAAELSVATAEAFSAYSKGPLSRLPQTPPIATIRRRDVRVENLPKEDFPAQWKGNSRSSRPGTSQESSRIWDISRSSGELPLDESRTHVTSQTMCKTISSSGFPSQLLATHTRPMTMKADVLVAMEDRFVTFRKMDSNAFLNQVLPLPLPHADSLKSSSRRTLLSSSAGRLTDLVRPSTASEIASRLTVKSRGGTSTPVSMDMLDSLIGKSKTDSRIPASSRAPGGGSTESIPAVHERGARSQSLWTFGMLKKDPGHSKERPTPAPVEPRPNRITTVSGATRRKRTERFLGDEEPQRSRSPVDGFLCPVVDATEAYEAASLAEKLMPFGQMAAMEEEEREIRQDQDEPWFVKNDDTEAFDLLMPSRQQAAWAKTSWCRRQRLREVQGAGDVSGKNERPELLGFLGGTRFRDSLGEFAGLKDTSLFRQALLRQMAKSTTGEALEQWTRTLIAGKGMLLGDDDEGNDLHRETSRALMSAEDAENVGRKDIENMERLRMTQELVTHWADAQQAVSEVRALANHFRLPFGSEDFCQAIVNSHENFRAKSNAKPTFLRSPAETGKLTGVRRVLARHERNVKKREGMSLATAGASEGRFRRRELVLAPSEQELQMETVADGMRLTWNSLGISQALRRLNATFAERRRRDEQPNHPGNSSAQQHQLRLMEIKAEEKLKEFGSWADALCWFLDVELCGAKLRSQYLGERFWERMRLELRRAARRDRDRERDELAKAKAKRKAPPISFSMLHSERERLKREEEKKKRSGRHVDAPGAEGVSTDGQRHGAPQHHQHAGTKGVSSGKEILGTPGEAAAVGPGSIEGEMDAQCQGAVSAGGRGSSSTTSHGREAHDEEQELGN